MKLFKKMRVLERIQLQNPETRLGLTVMVGLLIGVIMDNVGLGFLLGVVFASLDYKSSKKKKKEDITKTNKDK